MTAVLVSLLISIAVVAAYVVAAFSLGLRVLSFLSLAIDAKGTNALAVAIGLAVLGTVWSLVALIPNGLSPIVVNLILLGSIGAGLPCLLSWAKQLNPKAVQLPAPRDWWIAFPVLVFLLISTSLVFHPLGTDALAYYFAQAKLMAYAGGFVPDHSYYGPFTLLPLPAELHYSALIASSGGELSARLFTVVTLWTSTWLVFGLAGLCGAGSSGRWIAVLLFLTSTAVTKLISDGKTDLYGAMLALAAIYSFFALKAPEGRNLVIQAALAGSSFAAKVSFVPVTVPIFALLISWHYLRRDTLLAAVRKIAIAGLLTGAVIFVAFIPNIVKNAIWFGEPLAPFVFFGGGSSAGLLSQRWYSPEATNWILATYPLAWTMGLYPMQHGYLSPLVWAAVPGLLFIGSLRRAWQNPAFVLALGGVAGLLVWAVVSPGTIAPRYVFPALLALVPIAAVGIEQLWKAAAARPPAGVILGAALCTSMLLTIASANPTMNLAIATLIHGPENMGEGTVWRAMQRAEVNLPADGRLYLLSYERSPLSGKGLNCILGPDEEAAAMSFGRGGGVDLWAGLWQHGARAVLINLGTHKAYTTALDTSEIPKWMSIDRTEVEGMYALYRMAAKEDAPISEKVCAETRPGYWEVTGG